MVERVNSKENLAKSEEHAVKSEENAVNLGEDVAKSDEERYRNGEDGAVNLDELMGRSWFCYTQRAWAKSIFGGWRNSL